MKKIYSKLAFLLLTFFLLINIQTGFSQVVISGSSGAIPDGSAMLDIQSNSKGLLIPRLTTAQRTTIASPAQGLLVYDSDLKSFFIYGKTSKGTVDWYNLSENAGLWSQSGSAVYLSNTTYNVGIGTTKPTKKLVIKAANPNDTLLEIQDQNGYPLMVITPKLTKFNFIKSAKGISGGFAVGRYATAKNGKALTDTALLLITSDSTRIYTSEATGISGGFAVGRYATAKGGKSYVKKSFYTNYDSTRVYTDGSAAKGISGGFAVGRYATAKGSSGNYMYMIPENYFIGDQSGDSLQNSTYTGKYNTFFGYKTGLTDTSGGKNVLLGYEAGTNITSGSDNVLLGFNAGHSVTSAGNNISIGSNAGFSNSTANDNIFLGSEAGYFHTDANLFPASYNIYLGFQAGRGSVSGDSSANNLFIGYRAGYSVKSGGNNVFLGNDAGFSNDVATQNVFIGNNAGRLNTSGEGNVFIGDYSGESNVIGAYNVFLGRQTGDKFTGGNSNVFIGDFAGHEIITGTANSFIGSDAGRNAVAGSNNIFMGVEAGKDHPGGNDNVFLGNLAGSGIAGSGNLSERNVILGANAGSFIEGAIDNIFIGHKAGEGTTDNHVSGDYNVIIGEQAGNHITSGSRNVFLGNETGNNNTTGTNNVFLGYRSGFYNTLGQNNVFIGKQAGLSNKGLASNWIYGSNNVFLGDEAGLANDTGFNNVFIGYLAGHENIGGYNNVFIGTESGKQNTAGVFNTFMGIGTGQENLTGNSNTFIGDNAGNKSTTANSSVYMGRYAGYRNNGSENTFIGTSAGGDSDSAYKNVFVGVNAGNYHVNGYWNVIIGNDAGRGEWNNAVASTSNVIIGEEAAMYSKEMRSNVIIGQEAMKGTDANKAEGDYNTILGFQSGYNLVTGNYNVFLGYKAGYNETGSDKLYIDNSNTATPLIWGDFANDSVKIFSHLNVNNAYTFPSTDGTADQVMKTDGSGNLTWASVSSLDATTASNGLTLSGNDVQIGGSLTKSTTISYLNHDFYHFLNGTGDFLINDGSKIAFTVTDQLQNGTVGIGTDSPAANTNLHVLQSGTPLASQFAGTVACFQQNLNTDDWSRISVIGGNAGASVVDFGDADDQDIGNINYTHSDNSMRFTTNNSEKMRIESGGDVGIGITNPNDRLDVDGDVDINSGELQRTSTGEANLVPIAYGNISSTGSINSGSGNFSVSRTAVGTYQITITGENYYFSNYATSITPIGSGTALTALSNSVNNDLQISIRDYNNNLTDAIFSFVVYKP